jgi:5-oxoprolinase (ATP-hydrolysing) subunit A
MPACIDLNCDLGESFGVYCIGADEDVIPCVTSANVACGFHASDPNCMERTVRLCREQGVMVGAHPGYPDILGFGRRFMEVSGDELLNYVIYQVGALKGFLDYAGLPLQHVKLHGALYNHMVRDPGAFIAMAAELEKAFKEIIFLTLGTAHGKELKQRGAEKGLRIALEAFPDRAYTDEGELQGRKHKGAVLHDPEIIARRAITMAREKGIESVTGRWVELEADTLCIHGDNAESIHAARSIRALLDQEGIAVRPLGQIL